MDIRKIIREEVEKIIHSEPEVIQINSDEGSVFGVIHFDREHLKNWETKERVQPGFDTISDDELFPVGILKNINVDEEHMNQGFGSELLEEFLAECVLCQYVVLIADTSEENGFDIIDWYKSKGFAIFGESGGMPVMIKKINEKPMDDSLNEERKTNDSKYEFSPLEIWEKLDEIKSIGKKLDSSTSDNIENIKVISTGERLGRRLAEVEYPDGTIVLFYKSLKGTSGKEKGGWFPIPGFVNASSRALGISSGWFIKQNGVSDRYGVKTFQDTADYLLENEDSLSEIFLSVGNNPVPKPGIVRKFPDRKEGGNKLNIAVNDGPHEFPEAEDF